MFRFNIIVSLFIFFIVIFNLSTSYATDGTAVPRRTLDPAMIERLKNATIVKRTGGKFIISASRITQSPGIRSKLKVLTQTRLSVCPLAGRCQKGPWVAKTRIESDSEDQKRRFQWTTSVSQATEGVWQLAIKPFPKGAETHSPDVLREGPAGGLVNGSADFTLDFRTVTRKRAGKVILKPRSSIDKRARKSLTFYIRVIPMRQSTAVGKPSLPVVIDHRPKPPVLNVLSRTDLAMRRDPGEIKDVNTWVEESGYVDKSLSDQVRWFRWTSHFLPEGTKSVWQVSTAPFPQSVHAEPEGLIQTGDARAGKSDQTNPRYARIFCSTFGHSAVYPRKKKTPIRHTRANTLPLLERKPARTQQ